MADTLRDNPLRRPRPCPLACKLSSLTLPSRSTAKTTDWSEHHKDVFRAIRTCIIERKPIDKELQDQYVQALANYQAVNRFGQ